MASAWTCVGCAKANPSKARFCAGCGAEHAGGFAPRQSQAPPVVSGRYSYLQPKREDTYCRMHRVELDETGFCRVAQAWWYPKFACPQCHGWLYDNGYCETKRCTQTTRVFPGDYFEARFDDGAGREYGHYVRVHRGPTPVMTEAQVASVVAELHAIAPKGVRLIGQAPRQMGDEQGVEIDAEPIPF